MLETILLVKDFQPPLEQVETVQAILFLLTECSSYRSSLLPVNFYFRNSTEAYSYHVMLIMPRYSVEEGNGNLISFIICIVLVYIYVHQRMHTNCIKSQVIHKHEPFYMSRQ